MINKINEKLNDLELIFNEINKHNLSEEILLEINKSIYLHKKRLSHFRYQLKKHKYSY
jgi:hypothetical protein